MSSGSPPQWINKRGYIYAIKAESVGLVKIGFAADPHARYRTISSHSPIPLVLLGFVEATLRQELKLQRALKSCLSHNEWFRIQGAVIDFIAELPPPRPVERRPIVEFKRPQPKKRKHNGNCRDYFGELNGIKRAAPNW